VSDSSVTEVRNMSLSMITSQLSRRTIDLNGSSQKVVILEMSSGQWFSKKHMQSCSVGTNLLRLEKFNMLLPIWLKDSLNKLTLKLTLKISKCSGLDF